jgi:chromosome segregation ATPase
MIRESAWLAIASSIWLAGCGTDTCSNPAQAGFFGGVGNLMSGCYAREEERLSVELAAVQARRDALQAEAAVLEQRAQQLASERRVLTLRLAATQRELADLSRRLDPLSNTGTAAQAEVARLRSQEAGLASRLRLAGQTGTPPEEGDVRRLEEGNAQLRVQIQTLLRRLGRATE